MREQAAGRRSACRLCFAVCLALVTVGAAPVAAQSNTTAGWRTYFVIVLVIMVWQYWTAHAREPRCFYTAGKSRRSDPALLRMQALYCSTSRRASATGQR